MFRAVPCSSSGGQIVLLQHLVSSLQSALNRHTVRPFTESDDTRARYCLKHVEDYNVTYEGWNFNSGNYLFTTDTK